MTEKEEIAALRRRIVIYEAKIEEIGFAVKSMTELAARAEWLKQDVSASKSRLAELLPPADVHAPRERELPTPEGKALREHWETENRCLREMLEDCPIALRHWFLGKFGDAFGERNVNRMTIEQLQAARHTVNEAVGNGPGRGLFANVAAEYYEAHKRDINREVMARQNKGDGDGAAGHDS